MYFKSQNIKTIIQAFLMEFTFDNTAVLGSTEDVSIVGWDDDARHNWKFTPTTKRHIIFCRFYILKLKW